MKLIKKAGATSEIWQLFVADSSSTTGAGLTGLTNASGSLTAYYHRDTDTTATAISLVTMTVGTFTSSGFKEVDATNMPGWYQFCPPNAALASGAKSCAFHLKGASNMAPLPIEVELTAVDPDSATAFITGVNSLAPPSNWNLESIDANGRVDVIKIAGTTQTARDIGTSVLLSAGTGTGQLDFTSGVVKANAVQLLGTTWLTPGTAGTPDVNAKLIGATAQTGRDLGSSVLLSTGTGTGQLDFTSGVVKANATQWLGGTIPAVNVTGVPLVDLKYTLGTISPATAGSVRADAVTGAVGSVTGAVGSVTGAVGSVTGNVGGNVVGSVASVTAGVTVTTNNDKTGYTASTVSDKTGYALTSAYDPAKTASQAGDAMALTSGERTTLAASIWNALVSGLTTVGSIGKRLVDNLTGDIYARIGAPAGASVSADIAAVQSDTDNIQTRLPASLVSGRMDASVGAMATDVMNANALASDAVTEIQTGLSTLTAAGVRTAVGLATANLDTQLAAVPTAAVIADAVWDEAVSGHATSGSTGAALTAAQSAGDPWDTALPGSYASGKAGKILSDVAGYIDTEVAAIKAKTDNLPAAPAAVSDIPTAAQNADKLLGRNIAGGSDGGRMVKDAIRVSRNKVVIAAGTITVYEEDDTSVAWTGVITTDATADPITAVDPA